MLTIGAAGIVVVWPFVPISRHVGFAQNVPLLLKAESTCVVGAPSDRFVSFSPFPGLSGKLLIHVSAVPTVTSTPSSSQ